MNFTLPSRVRPACTLAIRFHAAVLLGAVILAAAPLAPGAQSDDFNDGDANGWATYDPIGIALGTAFTSYSVVNGAYRIQTPPSPAPAQTFNGRGGSLRTNVYSDFYVAVDIVNWDDTLSASSGILARVGTPGPAMTTGYAFTWDRGSSATSGDVDISRLDGEVPTGLTVSGSDSIHFEPGQKYRLIFIGRGITFEGRVYRLPDTTNAVVTVIGDDTNPNPFASGMNGLVVYDNTRPPASKATDITFDNYFATEVEPPRLILNSQFAGDFILSWPLAATGFKLQYSETLPATSWTDISDDLILADENLGTKTYFGTTPPTGNRYFRLFKP